ncbi:MAG: hypothetical protein K9I69_02415 [Ignavibacteriales bacterium]|nr:hypothetical protein [Ignavibacteriales bacterium]MCF8306504.1 hypothetical protein [Ignavibacteriales bacterium]MCF8316303.1 hypothetical protein [Ignavibacteriales bacterium]MCF8437739.1 hypothetical protein [Ignavibacteriales bacterium]
MIKTRKKIRIRTNRDVNILLVTVSVILGVVITIYFFNLFSSFEVSAKSYFFPGQNETKFQNFGVTDEDTKLINSYRDLNFEDKFIFKIENPEGFFEKQYIISADNFWLRQAEFYDLDRDGTKEIILLYHRDDSLFISIIDHTKRDYYLQESLVFVREGEKFYKIWDMLITIPGIIQNNKSEPVLYFSIKTSFAVLPRGVYSYNLETKKLNQFQFGAAIENIFFVDFNKDGEEEIVLGTFAAGNTWRLDPRPQFDDFSAWFFILDQDLKILKHTGIPGEFSSMIPGKLKNGNIVVLSRKEDGQRVRKYDSNGDLILEKQFPEHNFINLATNPMPDETDIVLLAQDTLFFFNEYFEQTNVLIPEIRDGTIYFTNLDDDEFSEILLSNTEKLIIYDHDLNLISSQQRGLPRYLNGHLPSYRILNDGTREILENGHHSLSEVLVKYEPRYYFLPLFFIFVLLSNVFILLTTKFLIVKIYTIISYFIISTNRATDQIYIFDLKFNLLFANRTAKNMFGLEPGFLMGKKNIFPLSENQDFSKMLSYSLKRRRPAETIVTINKNGVIQKFKCRVVPFSAPWKTPIALFVRAGDISRLIFEERQKVLTHSIQKVAHEIKTPLSSILLNLDSIEQNAESKGLKNYERDIFTARQEINRIKSFINKFLKMTNLQEPNLQAVSPSLLVNSALLRFSAYLEKNINVIIEGEERLFVWCDPFQLEDVFQVFIENSIDAMSGAGEIKIRWFRKDSSPRDLIFFQIVDNGAGIDEKLRDQVFDPYMTTKPQGTGMGLAIAKKILEDHGSDIKIVSPDGGGTIIEFCLTEILKPEKNEKDENISD